MEDMFGFPKRAVSTVPIYRWSGAYKDMIITVPPVLCDVPISGWRAGAALVLRASGYGSGDSVNAPVFQFSLMPGGLTGAANSISIVNIKIDSAVTATGEWFVITHTYLTNQASAGLAVSRVQTVAVISIFAAPIIITTNVTPTSINLTQGTPHVQGEVTTAAIAPSAVVVRNFSLDLETEGTFF
jgi:hypothetical protein